NSSAKRFPVNTVTIAMYGATVGKLGILKQEMATNQACCNIVVDPKKCDYRFLFYYLKYNRKELVSLANGAAQQNLNQSTILNFPFPNIKLEEQVLIADILSSFDDKIENNNAIIANLEEQSQTIFKSWFVDFEPFQDGEFIESELGRIPNNWTVVTLKEVSEEIVTGKTPPTKDPENYGNKMPFVTIPDMHNNVYAIETERLLSDKGIDTQSNKVVPKNSISVSCIATVGLVTLIASDSMTNQQINTVITKENISSYYVYNHLKTQSDYLNAIGSSGSTTKNVNKTTFSNLKMLLPSESILKK